MTTTLGPLQRFLADSRPKDSAFGPMVEWIVTDLDGDGDATGLANCDEAAEAAAATHITNVLRGERA